MDMYTSVDLFLFWKGEVCNFTAHNLSCGEFRWEEYPPVESKIVETQKAAATSAFTQYRPDTELLTHYATLPELGREVRSKTLGETCWNGNTTEESFSMWTVMMAPRLKTAEVQPSTLAKFVEPFFLVWNSMDAHDFVLEHFAENAIHPRKDHWWFGLKQITRYSAHGNNMGFVQKQDILSSWPWLFQCGNTLSNPLESGGPFFRQSYKQF